MSFRLISSKRAALWAPLLGLLFTACLTSPANDAGAGVATADASASAAAPREPGEGPAAVVLVTIDALRADYVTFANKGHRTTPFLADLARSGVIFDNAYAASSWTVPSVASLLTGLLPASHGVTTVRTDKTRRTVSQPVLPESLTTLAEVFSDAGYETFGFPANRHLGASNGFDQGFGEYYGKADFLGADKLNNVIRRRLKETYGAGWASDWRILPAFLWIHYFDPHDPYEPRIPWILDYAPDYADNQAEYPAKLTHEELVVRYPKPDASLEACLGPLYESEIRHCDNHFATLVREMGLDADNVLLIVTADHGEEFGKHGRLGHTESLVEELVHVPLVVRWPAGIPGGRRIATPVSTLDIFPTLADLLHLKAPAGLAGRSLAPLLRGEAAPPDREVLSERYAPKPAVQSIRSGDFKLVRQIGGSSALFDLRDADVEMRDVSAARPDVAKRLARTLDQRVAALPKPPKVAHMIVDDSELVNQLRGLGYVQ